MARIVIRCPYTGHYVFTGFDTLTSPTVASEHVFCPYCVSEHVWNRAEVRLDERESERQRKPLVRQAAQDQRLRIENGSIPSNSYSVL